MLQLNGVAEPTGESLEETMTMTTDEIRQAYENGTIVFSNENEGVRIQRLKQYMYPSFHNECTPKEKCKFPGAPLVNNFEILMQDTYHYVIILGTTT